jgi:hypothetical protein
MRDKMENAESKTKTLDQWKAEIKRRYDANDAEIEKSEEWAKIKKAYLTNPPDGRDLSTKTKDFFSKNYDVMKAGAV